MSKKNELLQRLIDTVREENQQGTNPEANIMTPEAQVTVQKLKMLAQKAKQSYGVK